MARPIKEKQLELDSGVLIANFENPDIGGLHELLLQCILFWGYVS